MHEQSIGLALRTARQVRSMSQLRLPYDNGPSTKTVSRRIYATSASIPTTPLPSRRARH